MSQICKILVSRRTRTSTFSFSLFLKNHCLISSLFFKHFPSAKKDRKSQLLQMLKALTPTKILKKFYHEEELIVCVKAQLHDALNMKQEGWQDLSPPATCELSSGAGTRFSLRFYLNLNSPWPLSSVPFFSAWLYFLLTLVELAFLC